MFEDADRITGSRSTGGRRTGGSGRRTLPRPKGRQVDPAALDEVRALLGDAPRSRDFLLDHLHRLQDRFGHLSAPHLSALAHELRLAQVEVFEVASFYAHFDLVMEGEAPPPPLTVRVCDGLSCELAGAHALAAAVEEAIEGGRLPGVRVLRAPCMGACDRAPAAAVGHETVAPAPAIPA
jgi:NADH:ubiquinone oxidoreductase subunit E